MPPFNPEAEAGVLGAILLDNSVFPEVIAAMGPADLYRDGHRTIYGAMLEMHGRGEPIDAITLTEELTRRDVFAAVGGNRTLAELLGVPHAANAVYYARIVRQKAVARGLVAANEAGNLEVYSGRWTAEDLIARDAERRAALPAVAGGARRPHAVMACLADVEPVDVRWLVPGKIPLGKVTMAAGEAKLGKSFWTMDLAARVTIGGEIPCGDGMCMEVGSVVVISAEDDLDDTIRPRLDAAGADVARVHALTTIRLPGGQFEPFTLAYLPCLEEAIRATGDVKLVIIDPVTHYVGSQTDDNRAVQLRAVLGPLKVLARETGAAVVIVSHMNKGNSPKSLNRVIGSGAYTALCRANWLFFRDPAEPGRRLMLDAGINVAESPQGLAYRIVEGRIVWEPAPITMSADEFVAQHPGNGGAAAVFAGLSKPEQADAFLGAIFAPGVERPSQAVLLAGEALGLTRKVLFAAKKKLGIFARKTFGTGEWAWYVPADRNTGGTQDTDESEDGNNDWTNT